MGITWALTAPFCENMALSTLVVGNQKHDMTRMYEAPPTGFEPVPPP